MIRASKRQRTQSDIALCTVLDQFELENPPRPSPIDKLGPRQLAALGAVLAYMEDVRQPDRKTPQWIEEHSWERSHQRAIISSKTMLTDDYPYGWDDSWHDNLQLIIPSLQWLGFHVYDYADQWLASQLVDVIISWVPLSGYPLDAIDSDDECERDFGPVRHIHYAPLESSAFLAQKSDERDVRALCTVLGRTAQPRFRSPTTAREILAVIAVLEKISRIEHWPKDDGSGNVLLHHDDVPDQALVCYLRQRGAAVFMDQDGVWWDRSGLERNKKKS